MNLRPPTEDDLAEIAALFNAVSQEFYGLDGASEQLLRTWFTSPTTDVERNLRLAVADGTIVGYADVDPRERAMLDFTVKLTEQSHRCTGADVEALREVGWTDEYIMDIAEVAAMFNFTNRLASGLGWRPNDEYFALGR